MVGERLGLDASVRGKLEPSRAKMTKLADRGLLHKRPGTPRSDPTTCEAGLSEVKAHSTCWAIVLDAPLYDGLRAQTTLERWHQVHDLLEEGNTVRRYARATASRLVSVTLRHHRMRTRAVKFSLGVAKKEKVMCRFLCCT
ncbi:hypothetical protein SVIO_103090 [Streptomyces violaceusniger]|uniref:Uncharacterized protein n=1 Tax=Streptomyces violaceusniger TaxID=68280 RepID=A0A4D4LK69_STRVO|nr:hypothetical protein SVIO_103090 [Streptomyces violaceusniger]